MHNMRVGMTINEETIKKLDLRNLGSSQKINFLFLSYCYVALTDTKQLANFCYLMKKTLKR